MGRLVDNVVVRHPESGEAVCLEAGTDVPEWAVALITNPAVYEQADADTEPDEGVESKPARRGRPPKED